MAVANFASGSCFYSVVPEHDRFTNVVIRRKKNCSHPELFYAAV